MEATSGYLYQLNLNFEGVGGCRRTPRGLPKNRVIGEDLAVSLRALWRDVRKSDFVRSNLKFVTADHSAYS